MRGKGREGKGREAEISITSLFCLENFKLRPMSTLLELKEIQKYSYKVSF